MNVGDGAIDDQRRDTEEADHQMKGMLVTVREGVYVDRIWTSLLTNVFSLLCLQIQILQELKLIHKVVKAMPGPRIPILCVVLA